MIRRPPTVAQLRIIGDRASRGRLTPDEVARLRDGINRFAFVANSRTNAFTRLNTMRRHLTELHAPVQQDGIQICRECSRWDGTRRRGPATTCPCPTLDILDATALDRQKENAA
ncbi:hypothetical protein ACQB60_06200 [Actinomycetota bacterium Odt1-20B]